MSKWSPLAQVDLSEVARLIDIPDLPKSGSLAFFMHLPPDGEVKGAVRYVRASGAPTEPVEPLPLTRNHSFGGPLLCGEGAEHQRLYTRMAMGLTFFADAVEGDWRARREKQDLVLGPCPKSTLQSRDFADCLPAKNEPFNRDSIQRLMHCARASLDATPTFRTNLAASRKRAQADIDFKVKALDKARAAVAKGSADPTARAHLESLLKLVESWQAWIARIDDRLANMDTEVATLAAQISSVTDWAQRGDRWMALTGAERAEIAPLLET